MSEFKAILVHVEPTKAAEARVKCAADLADRFGAILIGCGSEMIPVQVGDPLALTNGDLVTSMVETVDQHLAEAAVTFERIAAGRKQRWVASRCLPDEGLVQAARGADLIVTSRPPAGRIDATRNEDPGLLVVISGKPVLVVPPDKDYLSGDRVMVCWKDTRESHRAVSDAMPFLRAADQVLVVEVAPPSELGAACKRVDEVADLLRMHGVNATSEGLIRDERRTATILQNRAASFGADLVVTGGYGRSRLGEWAFGGVTKAFLEQTERFVLFSH